jgi:hypothetical protein
MQQNSASFGLFSVTSALRRPFNHCCVYCIRVAIDMAVSIFPSSRCISFSNGAKKLLRAFTVKSVVTRVTDGRFILLELNIPLVARRIVRALYCLVLFSS